MSTDLHTLSGAYAVNALSSEEAEDFRRHLEACPACREEVCELQEAAAMMGLSESVKPPAHLKANVMLAADRLPQIPPKVRHLGSPARSPRWTPRILAAAAAVVMVVAAGIGFSQMQQDDQHVVAASVTRVFNAPDAHTATMQTSNGGSISVATSPSLNEVAVDTDELPSLRKGQVYQMWTISNGAAKSAGLLDEPDRGSAMQLPPAGTSVAITIEPSGGSEQPTTKPIMSVVPSQV